MWYINNQEYSNNRSKNYQKENADSVKEYKKNYDNTHKEEIKAKDKAWKEANPDRYKFLTSNYTNTHKEEIAFKDKIWREANPDKCNAYGAKRRAIKKNATLNLPKEQNLLIGDFYKESSKLSRETGIPYEVDHIIPLQGEIVSGLHVPWNLRVVTKEENRKKSNKLISN